MLEEHLVAFIDLLGVRSLAQGAEVGRLNDLVKLLQNFKRAESDARYDVEHHDDRRRTRYTHMGVAAFSDNVVLSLSNLEEVGLGLPFLMFAQQIAGIFYRAIQFGCLIRGGIAKGAFYHSEGVVVGPLSNTRIISSQKLHSI